MATLQVRLRPGHFKPLAWYCVLPCNPGACLLMAQPACPPVCLPACSGPCLVPDRVLWGGPAHRHGCQRLQSMWRPAAWPGLAWSGKPGQLLTFRLCVSACLPDALPCTLVGCLPSVADVSQDARPGLGPAVGTAALWQHSRRSSGVGHADNAREVPALPPPPLSLHAPSPSYLTPLARFIRSCRH